MMMSTALLAELKRMKENSLTWYKIFTLFFYYYGSGDDWRCIEIEDFVCCRLGFMKKSLKITSNSNVAVPWLVKTSSWQQLTVSMECKNISYDFCTYQHFYKNHFIMMLTQTWQYLCVISLVFFSNFITFALFWIEKSKSSQLEVI